jgi:hypothetical protein
MDAEQKPSEEPSALAGGVIFFVFLAILGFGIRAIFNYYKSPPPVIALSAHFVDTNGSSLTSQMTSQELADTHLKIKGEVRKSGKPLEAGSVLLTAKKTDLSFEQTVAANLTTNGQFETEDPAFASLRPADEIYVKAEFLSSDSGDNTTQELYLNTNHPTAIGSVLGWSAVVFPLFAIILFFYAFTGTKTDRKNQVAIIFSYCIIGIFLAVPLLAPVLLLDAFPNSRRAMIGAPVGLIVTHVPEPDGDVQWALNIGGYSTPVAPSPTPTPSASPTPSPPASPVPPSSPPSTGATHPSQVSPTPATQPSPTGATPQSGTATQASPARPSPRPIEKSATAEPVIAKEADTSNDVVKVQGGLVIPLYVIVLSVIGGAINMTRKVPQLQGEGERSDVRVQPVRALRSLWIRISPFGKKKDLSTLKSGETTAETAAKVGAPLDITAASGGSAPLSSLEAESNSAPAPGSAVEPSKPIVDKEAGSQSNEKTDEDEANEIDAKLVPLVESFFKNDSDAENARKEIKSLAGRMQEIFEKKKDKKSILGFESFDDWMASRPVIKELLASHWRVELLSQYMYLISAPFLAIVAYYMLQLLGFTKLPILVLISFSVGLISEKILNWLLSLASGYLRSDTAGQSSSK